MREEEFAQAARLMGAEPRRIIGRHLIPSFMSHLIASATLSIPGMILGETALSFLGLGVRAPMVSWGVLLNDAQNVNVIALYPWLMLPVVPVVIVVLAFNFMGDLRDAADPYSLSGRAAPPLSPSPIHATLTTMGPRAGGHAVVGDPPALWLRHLHSAALAEPAARRRGRVLAVGIRPARDIPRWRSARCRCVAVPAGIP